MTDLAQSLQETTNRRNENILAELAVQAQAEWPHRDWAPLPEMVLEEQKKVLEADSFAAKDLQSQNNVRMSSFGIGCYRAVTEISGDKLKALDIVQSASAKAFKAMVGDYILARFNVDPQRPQEAFDRIAERFKAGGEERFGDVFKYDQVVQSDEESFVNISKCFFCGFMAHHGVPELTTLHCNMDAVWAEELEKEKYGVKFERPTLMSLGDDACRFQFTRKSK